MSGRYLRLDVRNAVRVGDTTLPGVLTSLAVNGELVLTQDQLEGSSATVTQVQGFTTATVALEITLVGTDDERERQLRQINKVFYVNRGDGQNGLSNAQGWRVVNPHLNARRIRTMLFDTFNSRDGNEDDSTMVSLGFKELLSEAVRLEKAAQQQQAMDAQIDLPGGPDDQAANGKGKGPPAPLNPYLQDKKDGRALVGAP